MKNSICPFTPKGTVLHVATIGYNNNFMSNSTSPTFLGVIIENIILEGTY
jgi:hypothetical protein